MKFILSLLFFSVGFAISGFAQDLKNPEPISIPLRSVPKSIQSELELPSFFSPEILLVDSTKVFIPNEIFTERRLKFDPIISEKHNPGIYPLPDPQSRMPIKTFDDSVNYTILRKEYK